MAVVSEGIQKIAEELRSPKLKLPKGWTQTGSLESLDASDSTSIVIFSRQFNSEEAKESRESESSAKRLGSHVSEDDKLIHVILKREDLWHEKRTHIIRRPLCLWLVRGNPADKFTAPDIDVFIAYVPKFYYNILETHYNDHFLHGFAFKTRNDFYSHSIVNSQLIVKEGNIIPINVDGFLTEEMSEKSIEMIFEHFFCSQAHQYFNEEESLFFRSICKFKKPSAEESMLYEKANKDLQNGFFDQVVAHVKKIHELSIKESREQVEWEGSPANRVIHDRIFPSRLPHYVDVSDAGIHFGAELEKVSPLHAIQCYEFITKHVEFFGTDDCTICVPFAVSREIHETIANVKMTLCGILPTDHPDLRDFREDAIRSQLSAGFADSQRNGLRLLQLHCGFGMDDAQFDINALQRSGMIEVLIQMANIIHHYKSKEVLDKGRATFTPLLDLSIKVAETGSVDLRIEPSLKGTSFEI